MKPGLKLTPQAVWLPSPCYQLLHLPTVTTVTKCYISLSLAEWHAMVLDAGHKDMGTTLSSLCLCLLCCIYWVLSSVCGFTCILLYNPQSKPVSTIGILPMWEGQVIHSRRKWDSKSRPTWLQGLFSPKSTVFLKVWSMDLPLRNLVVHVEMQIPGPQGAEAEPLTLGPGNSFSCQDPKWTFSFKMHFHI